ncbi:MAG: hypothetical protein ABII90_10390 [Bacteroidota bacterium]
MRTTEENIKESLQWDFDYIVIQDQFLVSDVIKNYPVIINMLDKIGGNGKISVYKYHPHQRKQSLHNFLGINKDNTLYQETIDFDNNITYSNWTNCKNISRKKFHSQPQAGFMDETIEFSSTFVIKANELKSMNRKTILFETFILWEDKFSDVHVVASIDSSTKQIYYTNFNLEYYHRKKGDWEKMQFLFPLPEFKTHEDILKVYIWNPGKNEFYYDDISLIIYD